MKHGLLIVPYETPQIVKYDSRRDLAKHLDLPGGGLVERVRVGEEWALAIDEEGRYRHAPIVNSLASVLYGTLAHGTPVVGAAVLCKEGPTDEGIDWVDTTAEEIAVALAEIVAFRAEMLGLEGLISRLG